MKNKEQSVTFLGKNTNFEGKMSFSGTMRIDGHIKGEISADGNLVVGEEGVVEADIHSSSIVVRGEIHGNITADQRVDIRAPGKVFGNIEAPSVVIDEGVIFEGQTRMYRAKGVGIKTDQDFDTNGPIIEPSPGLTAIYGMVSDEKTGSPLKNVSIVCKGGTKKNIKTNAAGYYELTNLREGKLKIIVKIKGYRVEKIKMDITGEGTKEQNFRLIQK